MSGRNQNRRAGKFGLALIGAVVFATLQGQSLAAAETWNKRIEASSSADVRGATTQEEALARARDEARREAVRRACGTIVKSSTTAVVTQSGDRANSLTVSEASVAEEGIVIGEDWSPVQAEKLMDPGTRLPFIRYTVTGRFEVVPLPEGDNSLSVRLTLNRKQLIAGQDTLTLNIEPSENVYVLVFNLAADEKVYPIYPNEHLKGALQLPGRVVTRLPRESDPIVLRPAPAQGHKRSIERVRVIASRKPIAPPSWGGAGSLELHEFFRWQHRQLRLESFAQADAAYEVRSPGGS